MPDCPSTTSCRDPRPAQGPESPSQLGAVAEISLFTAGAATTESLTLDFAVSAFELTADMPVTVTRSQKHPKAVAGLEVAGSFGSQAASLPSKSNSLSGWSIFCSRACPPPQPSVELLRRACAHLVYLLQVWAAFSQSRLVKRTQGGKNSWDVESRQHVRSPL